jgi:hypothetical protein
MNPLVLGYNAFGNALRLRPDDRRTHMHVIGSSGSGKSKFLEWMMRGDLRNRQGFCLIDPHGALYHDVANYCAHHVLGRDIVLLDLSSPGQIVGFNPFERAPEGDVSVQVDRRISATMHAWNVKDTDQTPTLARTLRLIYTVMIEQNLGLPQVEHLIDFKAQTIRDHLVEALRTPLIQKEWRELQELRAKEWRDETLSAKNRLFRFLTSPTLARFMGIPGRSLDLFEIMEQGKVLLVNLAPSDYLSQENARVFGALVVNQFFETALRRKKDPARREPKPYYLYLDEFQNFVSIDIAEMLDQIRKFGVFAVLSHQRFGHLDENITDAVLTNCRIKAVFGGLPIESAKLMAQELFIGELDPKKVKIAIHQTKFWPEYRRDKVYSRGTTHSISSGSSTGSAATSLSGVATAQMFLGDQGWTVFQSPAATTNSTNSGSNQTNSTISSQVDSYGDTESEADIPIFFPVPFQELSNIQYYTPEEQLVELTAALKEQYGRHCFIKIHNKQTQPLLVPFVKEFYTTSQNIEWYRNRLAAKQNALPASEIDLLLKAQENALVVESSVAETEPPQSRLPAASPLTIEIPKPKKPRPARAKRQASPNLFEAIKRTEDE